MTSNILVIDEEPAINYSKSQIDNDVNYIKSLSDLYLLFNDEPSDIFKYSTISCISLILRNGKEISLHEYKEGEIIKFLKISTPELEDSDNDILISMTVTHNVSNNEKQWVGFGDNKLYGTPLKIDINDNLEKVSKNPNFINGYCNCQKIVSNISKRRYKSGYLPAIEYCYEQRIYAGKHVYQGYLPAIGQLKIMSEYIDMINYILGQLQTEIIYLNNSTWWWSSNEANNDDCAYILANGKVEPKYKDYACLTLPLFHYLYTR